MLNLCEMARMLLIYCEKSYNIVIENMESFSNTLNYGGVRNNEVYRNSTQG